MKINYAYGDGADVINNLTNEYATRAQRPESAPERAVAAAYIQRSPGTTEASSERGVFDAAASSRSEASGAGSRAARE